MKQILAFVFLIFTLFSCITTQVNVEVPEDVDLPKRVLFLAQSGTATHLFQTVIDLDTNELVLLLYDNTMLKAVYRTGITVNPKDYRGKPIPPGTDNPYNPPPPPTESDNNPNTANGMGASSMGTF